MQGRVSALAAARNGSARSGGVLRGSSAASSSSRAARKCFQVCQVLKSFSSENHNNSNAGDGGGDGKKKQDEEREISSSEQDRLLNKGVAAHQLESVLLWKKPAAKEKAEGAAREITTWNSKLEAETASGEENVFSSSLYYASGYIQSTGREVLYARWPCDSGASSIEDPFLIGPEFDVYVSASPSGEDYGQTSLPLFYVDPSQPVVVRPRALQFSLCRSLLQHAHIQGSELNLILSLLAASLLRKLEHAADSELKRFSTLLSSQLLQEDEDSQLWLWPALPGRPRPVGNEITNNDFRDACNEAAAYCGMSEEHNPWQRVLSTVRGRRYFFHKELHAIEAVYSSDGKLLESSSFGSGTKQVDHISMREGLLRLSAAALQQLSALLLTGDPFELCFRQLSPFHALLPELSSASYRAQAVKRRSSIERAHLTAVAIYQEVLKVDACPLYHVKRHSPEALQSLEFEDKKLMRTVFYRHSDDVRPESDLEEDTGHCYTHLSTILRLFGDSALYDVVEGLKLLQKLRIIAVAPALCKGEDTGSERHVYLRRMYRFTLDLVASLVEIERRALCWRRQHSVTPSQNLHFMSGSCSKLTLSPDQQQAVDAAVRAGSLGGVLTGTAGTGKTATLAHMAAHFHSDEIIACALTGRASDILNQKVTPADTSHHYYYSYKRFKYRSRKREKQEEKEDEPPSKKMKISDEETEETEEQLERQCPFLGKRVLIMDESSLMPLHLAAEICKAAVESSAVDKIFITGDEKQLDSVESGCVLSDLVKAYSQIDEEQQQQQQQENSTTPVVVVESRHLHQLNVCHRLESLDVYNNAMAIQTGNVDELQTTENFVILESTGSVSSDADQLYDYVSSELGEEVAKKQFHVQCSQNQWVAAVNKVAYDRFWQPLDDAEDQSGYSQTFLRHMDSSSSSGGNGEDSASAGVGKKRKRFRPGCRIYYRKNYRNLPIDSTGTRSSSVKNGQILEILFYQDVEKESGKRVKFSEPGLKIEHQFDKADLIRGKRSKFRRLMVCQPYDAAPGQFVEVPLDRAPLSARNVNLAHSATTHKTQGTECCNVGIITTKKEPAMVTRAWLYTAVTRAKRKVFIVTTPECLLEIISRPPRKRLSDVAILLVNAVRELYVKFQAQPQQSLPSLASSFTWWQNRAGVRPFTAIAGWDAAVPTVSPASVRLGEKRKRREEEEEEEE